MIEYAISLDNGDGEGTMSYFDLLNGKKPSSITCSNNTFKTVSSVSYDDNLKFLSIGQPTLGSFVAVNFKRCPEEWDGVCLCIKDSSGKITAQKTYRDVMKDFIGNMYSLTSNNNYNPNLSTLINKDNHNLFVGCPSDITWTSTENINAFTNLIQEATGLPKEQIFVVPESTAAIFSAIANAGDSKVSPKEGVVIFDIGSSTSDFTYIRLGEIAELSRKLGAKLIESNMYECALTQNNVDLTKVSSYGMQSQIFNMRLAKEEWFGDGVNIGIKNSVNPQKPYPISYYDADEYGNPTKDVVNFLFTINPKTMDTVLTKMPVCGVTADGKPIDKELSWSGHLEKFFESCKGVLTDQGLKFNSIVLTGGASRMDIVEQLCSDVFCKEENNEISIYREPSPSCTVSNGLCYIAKNKSMLDKVADEQKQQRKNDAGIAIGNFKTALCEDIAKYYLSELQDEINVLTLLNIKKITINDLLSRMNNRVQSNYEKKMADMVESEKYIIDDCYKLAATLSAASAAETLYKDKNMCAALQFTELPEQIFEIPELNFGTHGIIIPIHPLFNTFANVLIGIFKNIFRGNHNPTLNLAQLNARVGNNHTLQNFAANPSTEQIVDQILANQFGINNKGFYNKIEELSEKAVRIVALEYFEKRINIWGAKTDACSE